MAKRHGIRLSRTVGKAPGVIEKTAVGLFRWAATDHTGMAQALEDMPPMGFLDELKYIFMQFLCAMASAVFTGIWIFVLIAYGMPLQRVSRNTGWPGAKLRRKPGR